jgi:ribokinase
LIVVFGSINIDFLLRVARLPGEGETVAGQDVALAPGGKGANQALAARKAGASVKLVCAVGNDAFADLALANLVASGVDLSGLRRVTRPTGAAFITIDDAGRNHIVLSPGANQDVKAADFVPVAGEILLVQRELPEGETCAVLRKAKDAGMTTIVNTAPSAGFAAEMRDLADIVIANEHEIADVAGRVDTPEALAADLAKTGKTILLTLGAEGALAAKGGQVWRAPASKVNVVDTTGAGDTFCGAFAAALDEGKDIGSALAFAAAAGSLACTGLGAQSATPDRAAILKA